MSKHPEGENTPSEFDSLTDAQRQRLSEASAEYSEQLATVIKLLLVRGGRTTDLEAAAQNDPEALKNLHALKGFLGNFEAENGEIEID